MKLPFSEHDFYNRVDENGNMTPRTWLSIKTQDGKVEAAFCVICISFSSHRGHFTNGFKDFRRSSQMISRHEKSAHHCDAVKSYVLNKQQEQESIGQSLNSRFLKERREEVQRNVAILKRVVDVIKVLAKQNLAFRGPSNNDSLYQLENPSINHGNFLELINLLGKYDEVLGIHLKNAILKSKQRRDQTIAGGKTGHQAGGRGSLITFLSKTIVNRIIDIICDKIKSKIAAEAGRKIFSIQIDSSQDIAAFDQCTIVLRYLQESVVVERLVAVLKVEDSSGRGLFEHVEKLFNVLHLDFSKLIGMSFDGAGNMRGQYNGLQSHLKKQNPNAVYVWCYAHRLNLCVSDCCDVLDAKNLFGLLNRLATFIGESSKRTDIWTRQLSGRTGNSKSRRLNRIGETRWWAKQKAIEALFGQDNLFIDTIEVLHEISNCGKFDGRISSEAESLFEKLADFRTILTAHIFLAIFRIIGPVSKYLQTSGLNLSIAWQMVSNAMSEIEKIDFESVNEKALAFVEQTNDEFNDDDRLEGILIDPELKEKRFGRKKRMAGENCYDERPKSPIQQFRVEVFRPILDQIYSSLKERFSDENIGLESNAIYYIR